MEHRPWNLGSSRFFKKRRIEFSRRQHMIMAWALIALVRGILYTPVHPGYGDFPLPLKYVFSAEYVWITGVVWLGMASIGIINAIFEDTVPEWFDQLWWVGIIGGVAGWGGMYMSGIFVPGGTFALVAAGGLYLCLAYGMWATKGHPPIPDHLQRTPHDRHTPSGEAR
jgi:hypothetical protein